VKAHVLPGDDDALRLVANVHHSHLS
jgi:hypothetical protein